MRTRLQKQNIGDYKIFQFLANAKLFFVVVRTGLSEGDDRRIFWGSEFSIPRRFWEGKFGKYFLGRPDLSMDFWGIQNTYFTNVS